MIAMFPPMLQISQPNICLYSYFVFIRQIGEPGECEDPTTKQDWLPQSRLATVKQDCKVKLAAAKLKLADGNTD